MNSASELRGRDRPMDPVDRHVGERLRLARKMLKLSQEGLAEHLGVTFQQVQKYEKGINRISASRLHQAAAILDVPVSFFFPETGPPPAHAGLCQDTLPKSVMECLASREGMELVLAFSRIADDNLRSQVVQLVQSVAVKRGE